MKHIRNDKNNGVYLDHENKEITGPKLIKFDDHVKQDFLIGAMTANDVERAQGGKLVAH